MSDPQPPPKRKRPDLPALAPVNVPSQESALKITDTMTLIVKDNDGQEMRVKETGRAPPKGDLQTPASTKLPVEGMMNNIHFEDLKILELLGAGSQGKVRKAQHRITKEYFAIKSIAFAQDKETMRNVIQGELKQVNALKHPNVVSSFEAYFREGKLYVVLEFMDCGTMSTVVKGYPNGLPDPIVAYVAKNLLTGLAYLHSQNVIHRDMKPANVLANSKGEVKISDFGVATELKAKQSAETIVGSTPYMSPERVKSQPYNFSCDLWSVGLTIAEIAIGKYPFGNLKSKVFELTVAIANNQVAVDWKQTVKDYSKELVDFVDQCLKPADVRPTATDLLNHPFMKLADEVDAASVGSIFKKAVSGTVS